MKKKYTTGNLSNILGTTRDTLRHYESKGLIQPKQNTKNSYREYGFYDMYKMMAIDFYKKRGMSLEEIKEVQIGEDINGIHDILKKKENDINDNISVQKKVLQNIRSTINFCSSLDKALNTHSIKPMPLFEVKAEFSDFTSFQEYENILRSINSGHEDILSNIARMITTENNEILGSKMLVLSQSLANKKCGKQQAGEYLDYRECVYSVVEDGRYRNGDENIMEKTFKSVQNFAKENNYLLLGQAYVFTRLIAYEEDKERVFLEIYTPIKNTI